MALAAAGLGESDKAIAYAREAAELTNCVEAKFPRAFALAILALRAPAGREPEDSSLHAVARDALAADCGDALVLAYRAHPRVLEEFASSGDIARDVARVIGLAHDHHLGATFGILPAVPAPPGAPSLALTPREWEILGLLATGLSNRDIANRLFISLSTTKSHIIHIFRKLGVNSRVQAVVNYKQLLETSARTDSGTRR
jgi:DNA-binding NarL/FixJ family response regulator